MREKGDRAGDLRPVTYCLIPSDLAPWLHEHLRRHFAGDASIEVIVERRVAERRHGPERRDDAIAGAPDRRRIRSRSGRRVAERRASLVTVDTLPLPRRARPHTGRIEFVERLEPSSRTVEDADTARLVARIQGGDRDAFALLYMRYFDRVYGYLRIALASPHEAEDATQQVFVNVMQALPRYQEERAPFRAWLFVIVRNYALSQLRHRGRLELVEPSELARQIGVPPDGDPDEGDLRALSWVSDRDLLVFIERLPFAQQQVLLLRFMLDLSHTQTAAVLDRSVADVRNLQSRALRFLRARLVAIGREPRRARTRMVRCPPKAPVLRSRRFALWR
jgi:RNA polymerase sigma-70 factor (ECF subfamily)